jgi:hypothetical protein
MGLWIHNDHEETRQVNFAMIQEAWKIASSSGVVEGTGPEAGPALQAVGRKLSLSELFTKQNGLQMGG